MTKRPVTTADILDGHVSLDLECLDRIYLNGYVPNLQVGGQVVQFLASRGFPIPSPAVVGRIGDRFRASVRSFADSNQIPFIKFRKGDRKLTVMKPFLARQERRGRSGVAAIGWAQEFQRVATCTTTPARSGGAPHFGWERADRRVTCYYFYVVDDEFGPAFVKIGSYFPYPVKVCLLTELNREGPRRCGKISSDVATVQACDQRRAVPGPVLAGSAAARVAQGNWGSVRAVSSA
jgi:hypothetical protein